MKKTILTLLIGISLSACSAKVLRLNSGTPAQFKVNCEMSGPTSCKEKAEELCHNGYKTDQMKTTKDILLNDVIQEMYITCK